MLSLHVVTKAWKNTCASGSCQCLPKSSMYKYFYWILKFYFTYLLTNSHTVLMWRKETSQTNKHLPSLVSYRCRLVQKRCGRLRRRACKPNPWPAFPPELRPLLSYLSERIKSSLCFCVAFLPIEELTLLLEHIAETREQVKINTQMLQELLRRQRGADTLKSASVPEHLKSLIPVKDHKDLLEVEKSLKNKDTAKQMVCCILG